MDFRSAKRFIPAILLAFAMSPAVAQQAGANGAAPNADGKVVLKKAVPATPKEQQDEANRLIQGMKGAATNASSVLWKARGAGDAEKQLCANEKVSEANTAVRTAEDRLKSLVAAGANDPASARLEFTMIRALAERSDQLVLEAKQCIGEEAGSVGETVTNATVDPDIPTEETLTGFVDGQSNGNVVNDIPRCTSCN